MSQHASQHAQNNRKCLGYMAIVERDTATGLLVGSLPGVPGAHALGSSIEEVQLNLGLVLTMLEEQGALRSESEFIGIVHVRP